MIVLGTNLAISLPVVAASLNANFSAGVIGTGVPVLSASFEPGRELIDFGAVLDGRPIGEVPPQEIRRQLFFHHREPAHQFTLPEEIRMHHRGTPSSNWDCIVEAAYSGSITVLIENTRTENNTIFIPGRSGIAEFVKLIANEGDLLRIHLRYTPKDEGKHLKDLEKLQEKMRKVIEGRMTPWEETEVSVQIAEGTIEQAQRGPLAQEEAVRLCRELSCSPNSVVVLRNETRDREITLRSRDGGNGGRLGGFIIQPGETLQIKVISRAARYLRDSFIAAVQGDLVLPADLEERAMQFTVSGPGTGHAAARDAGPSTKARRAENARSGPSRYRARLAL